MKAVPDVKKRFFIPCLSVYEGFQHALLKEKVKKNHPKNFSKQQVLMKMANFLNRFNQNGQCWSAWGMQCHIIAFFLILLIKYKNSFKVKE